MAADLGAAAGSFTWPTPITARPYTIGLWFYPTSAAANMYIWAIGNSGTGNNQYAVRSVSAQWRLMIADANPDYADGGTLTVNKWHYIVARFISNGNARMHVLEYNGVITNILNSSGRNQATPNRMGLGHAVESSGGSSGQGMAAEFFYTNTDIQADGGVLSPSTLRQLAFRGPWSIPHIAKDIIEYHSLRKDYLNDMVPVKFGLRAWAQTGTVKVGQHPPLAAGYVQSKDFIQNIPM